MKKTLLFFCFISILVVFVQADSLHATIVTSTVTGDFSTGSTWVGGVVPVVTDTVVIANGDTVSFNSILTLRYLIINAGGVLENLNELNITESGGSGTLFTIDGLYLSSWTFTYFSPVSTTSSKNHINGAGTISGNGGDCYWTFLGSANSTAQFDATSTLTFDLGAGHLSTGATANVYFFGTTTFISGIVYVGNPCTGTGYLTIGNTGQFISAGDLEITSGGIVYNYGIVTVEGDIVACNINPIWYNYAGSTVNITGDFLKLANGTGANGKFFANYSGNTVNYNGTGNQKLLKKVFSTYYPYWNLICSNSGKKTLVDKIIVNGNLSIQDAAQLDDSTNFDITLKGDWNNTSTDLNPFIEQAGRVILSGTTPQTITASPLAGGETFYNLTINNTSTSGDTLKSPVTVSNSLTLTDGIVFTDATNLLILNDNATSGPGSSASFVDGPMKKIGDDAFVFPVGDSAVWARIGISAPSGLTTEYTAQYIDSAYGDGTLSGDLSVDASLHHVSSLEYWTLAQAINNDDVAITLYWEDASVNKITDCTDLTIGHFTGSDWVEEPSDTNSASICSGTGSGSITTNAVVTDYSPFTLASKYGGWATNPLPIKLVSFEGKNKNNEMVELTWTTATETNNDYFTVEKTSSDLSKGGELTFVSIGTVKGAGNSSAPLNYHLLDESPSPSERAGVRYYRLKQTDYDGKYSYSSIIFIPVQNTATVAIYPNPAADRVTVICFSKKNESLSLYVIDKLGRIIINMVDIMNEGQNVIDLDVSDLSNGVYLLRIANRSGDEERRQLMVCKH